MSDILDILHIEDDENDALLVSRSLSKLEPQVHYINVVSEADLRKRLEEREWDVILFDYNLPGFSMEGALAICLEHNPLCPLIVVSRTVGEETTVEMLHQGVCDVVLKSNLKRLPAAVLRGLREAETRREIQLSQRSLHESQIRYRMLWENSTTGYLLLHHGIFVDSNETICKELGYEKHEIAGKTPADFSPEYQPNGKCSKELAERLCSEAEADKQSSFHWVHLHRDGTPIHYHITLNRLKVGERLVVVGALQNVTDKIEVEKKREELSKQVLQLQRLETIGTLAGGIAHDFNNLLAAIRGWAEMAQRRSGSSAEVQEDLQHVLVAVKRATGLVRQLLVFSRDHQVKVHALDPLPLIKEAIKTMRSTIPTCIGIELTAKKGIGSIKADPSHLHQVIFNIFTNAAQAIGESKGKINIVAENITMTCTEADSKEQQASRDWLRLTISDNGPGMDEATRQRVFEPFFTTKPFDKGTGLGLAVVHGIVTSYGGTILVDAKEGEGTTFTIDIPTVESSAHKALENDHSPQKGKERILLVDDEEELVDITSQLLNQLGYEVELFIDSEMALDSFQQSPDTYDIMICDQIMPNMTGLELMRKVRIIRPSLPVIFMTGYSTTLTSEVVAEIPYSELVHKPCPLADMTSLIRKLITENSPDTVPASSVSP